MSLNVGITGTRRGATAAQVLRLAERLAEAARVASDAGLDPVLRHGDCVGVDAQAHDIAKSLGFRVVVHPPADDRARAHVELAHDDVRFPPLPYLERNARIVEQSDLLLAVPDGPERLRSGTWSTVRYARRLGVRVEVLEP